VKSIALLSLALCACSGAPFSVAQQDEAEATPDEASAPDASPDVAPEASAPVPDAGAPDVAAPPPDVAAPVPEASAPDVSAPDVVVPPPGTLCCRIPAPSDPSKSCFPSGALTSYPCGTILGGWIYSVSSTDASGMIHVADVDCTYGPPTTANIGTVCRWPVGSAPSTADCDQVGAVVECSQ
jgi:hypothetical protein